MAKKKSAKSNEEAPVAPDAPSATQNITADQAGTSSDHEAQHSADPTSDKPGEGASHQPTEPKPHQGGVSKTVKEVATDKLKPHALSTKIYTPKISGGLAASVLEHGVLVPLLVARDTYEVIAGNSRLAAAIQAGLQKVPVIYFESTDELEIRKAILETNNQREKNTEQKIREFLEWMDIEKEGGKRRMATNSGKGGVYNSTQADTGKSRDKAALKIGMSGLHAERGGQVVKAIDELAVKGDEAKAKELTERLNGRSINSAYKSAVEAGMIVKAGKSITKPKSAKSTSAKAAQKADVAVAKPSKVEGSVSLYKVKSHADAIDTLDAITNFAEHLDGDAETMSWRPKWVDSVNALCSALASVGLIIPNVGDA